MDVWRYVGNGIGWEHWTKFELPPLCDEIGAIADRPPQTCRRVGFILELTLRTLAPPILTP